MYYSTFKGRLLVFQLQMETLGTKELGFNVGHENLVGDHR